MPLGFTGSVYMMDMGWPPSSVVFGGIVVVGKVSRLLGEQVRVGGLRYLVVEELIGACYSP